MPNIKGGSEGLLVSAKIKDRASASTSQERHL